MEVETHPFNIKPLTSPPGFELRQPPGAFANSDYETKVVWSCRTSRRYHVFAAVRCLTVTVMQIALTAAENNLPPLRPPAVPLVACDPYFSIWSPADKLTDADTEHWTSSPHRLTSLVRIDGKTFRLMGKEPADVPALLQTNLEVLPTRTVYAFEGEGMRVKMTFMTPALPEDLMVYSRPLTYLTWELENLRRDARKVEVLFGADAEIAVNDPTQQVVGSSENGPDLTVLKIGSTDQPVLAKRGDMLRIDWGYFYLAAPQSQAPAAAILPAKSFWRDGFVNAAGSSSAAKVTAPPAPAGDLVAAMELDCGKVGGLVVSRWLMLAYDDEYSIQYFKQNLRPYWRRNGDNAGALLKKAAADYDALVKRCAAFDTALMADLAHAGGQKYAELCALAYRQCYAGNKLVADANGQPLIFSKENSSSGMICTVDLIYLLSPQLLLSPSLAKAMLVPILDYASSTRWPWPYAPHDLGLYPVASRPIFGGGEVNGQPMPVEETGNMLIMLAALAQIEGHTGFCEKYWPLLEKWADYLQTNGFDPAEQLCADDFSGTLAHNANLSVKTICALGAFARLCDLRGDQVKAREWLERAKGYAAQWVKAAADGDHYRLAFDQPGTWSQKYNLVWDRILGLDLFPDSVREQEMKFYRTKQNAFGLPLDHRETYTINAWTLWTATLTQNRDDFAALFDPIWRFINETKQRVPISDWVWTQQPIPRGFQARPVVGAFFLQMLYDRDTWKKWASYDTNQPANWATFLKPPKLVVVVPTAENEPMQWRYTMQAPPASWPQPAFDDRPWKAGPAGFGIKGATAATVRTEWNTADIWLRREVTLPEGNWTELSFRLYRSVGVQIYLNGVLAATFPGDVADYQQVRVKGQARLRISPGRNVIAVHAARAANVQFIDVGIVDVRPDE